MSPAIDRTAHVAHAVPRPGAVVPEQRGPAGSTVAWGTVLQQDAASPPVAAPWAGPLLALGARLARQPDRAPSVRLVVAITVPARAYAALLVAAGWALTRPIKTPPPPAELLQTLPDGAHAVMVAGDDLVAGPFRRDDRPGQRRIRVKGTPWLLDRVDILLPAPELLPAERFGRRRLSPPGTLAAAARPGSTWAASQATAGSDVVLIGTKLWLEEEMTGRPGQGRAGTSNNSFAEILRPDDGESPAWGSAVLPAAKFEEAVVPSEAKLAVLDGNTAIGWLGALCTDFAVVILDRSIDSDFAANSVLQLRSMGASPVPLARLRWRPPPGVEALAFEARR